MRTRIRAIRVLVATLLIGGLFLATASGVQATERHHRWHPTAKLTLVHGIAGDDGQFPVDITLRRFMGGAQRFEDVTYGTVAGPLEVRPGLYKVAIRPAGAPMSSPPVLKRWVRLGPWANRSVVAHLSADGAPTISVYRNDVSDSGADMARVTVRHDAAVGPVNVFANDAKVISWLKNPRQAKLDVPADVAIQIRVALAGGGPTVFDAPLSFAEDTNTIVYATLDQDGNFNPLLQILPTA
jgi:hypothetical protein